VIERDWLRHGLQAALLTTAGALLLASIFLLYGRTTLFDADRFSDRAVEALQQPAVRSAVADQIVDRIVAAGDPDLVAVRPLLISVTETAVQSSAFERVFRKALQDTHNSVFAGDRDTLVLLVSNAVVLVSTALERVNPSLADRMPKDAAAALVRISDSRELAVVAAFARDVRQWAIVTLLLGLTALAGSVAIAKRRFRAIRLAGSVVALSGLIALLFDRLLDARLVGSTSEPLMAAAEAAYEAMTGPLRTIALVYFGAGMVTVAATAAVTRPADLERSIASLARPLLAALTAPATSRAALLLRAAIALAVGLVLVWHPMLVLEAMVVALGILLLAQTVRDVTAAVIGPRELAAEAAAEGHGDYRHVRRLVLAALATLALVAIVGTWPRNTKPLSVLGSKSACNGSDALCDRPLANVALPATHNSMSAADDRGWLFPEQNRGIDSQLRDGIRGLLIDVYYGYPGRRVLSDVDFDDPGARNEAIRSFGPQFVAAAERLQRQITKPAPGTKKQLYLCHGFCELGATAFEPALLRLRDWLDTNPREVVVVVIEDYVPAEAIVAAFERAGLRRNLYDGRIDAAVPTLRGLIDSDRRLVVFGENIDQPYDGWYQPAFDFIQETPFDVPSIKAFDCRPNRGEPDNPLFMMNNWVSTPPASLVSNARRVNTKRFLLNRATECKDRRGRTPSLIPVDFYKEGNLQSAIETLNATD
jgi:hypothetical protein